MQPTIIYYLCLFFSPADRHAHSSDAQRQEMIPLYRGISDVTIISSD